MTKNSDSAAELIERLKRKAPAYLDLISAEGEEEFEAAFTTILETAVSHLEKNKKKFAPLPEKRLFGVLAAPLTMPGLAVTQETIQTATWI
jgi:phytoene/squalene synthetase